MKSCLFTALLLSSLSAAPLFAQTPVPTAPAAIHAALPTIPDRIFSLTDFGGNPDGKTLNTDAFAAAIKKISDAGGGHLNVPKGTYRTLPFTLCSNLDLHLEDGAVIQAPDSFTGYNLPEPSTLSSQADVRSKVPMPAPLISGKDLHDVAITGNGTIDGNGAIWWAQSERASRIKKAADPNANALIYPRPKMVVIANCERLHIDGVTFTNSPMFHLVPTHITDLLIERCKFKAPLNAPNTDAMDPGRCTNMVIRDCDIDVGDDDVAIKSGGQHMLVEDCRIKHGHGISIGSETTDGISNFLVRRCSFDGADNAIRIKSMRGAGGLVTDVRYTDITMKNVGNAIILDLLYTDSNRPNFKGDPTKIPVIQNVLIDNVTAENCKNAGRLVGLPDSPFKNVVLRNVHITAAKDFVIKDEGDIKMEDVTRDIKKGAGPAPTTPIE